MVLAEIIHSVPVFYFGSSVLISKDWQASVLCIQRIELLKVLKLRSYRTCCLKYFLEFCHKSEKLYFVSWVTCKGHWVLQQTCICKEFLRMKNILVVLHKTLQIACLLILTLHSFSSSCLWHERYDSLRGGVSDFTFQEQPLDGWAYKKTVHALDAKVLPCCFQKSAGSRLSKSSISFLKIYTGLCPVSRSTTCRANAGQGTAPSVSLVLAVVNAQRD